MKNMSVIVFFLFYSISSLAEEVTASKNDVEQCYDYLYSQSEIAPIKDKMNFGNIENPTFEQLANVEIATDTEKNLISKLSKGFDVCEEVRSQSKTSDIPNSIVKVYEDNNARRKSSLIDLYNRKITYGEYLLQRQSSISIFKRDYDLTVQNINENNLRAEASQRASKNKAWANFFGSLSESIKRNQPSKPINCNPNGLGGVICR